MIIIGAGNLGKHIIDQLEQDNYQGEIIFFDEKHYANMIYNKYSILHSWDDFYNKLETTDNEFFIALGNPRIREKVLNKVNKGKYTTLISKHAGIVSKYSSFGNGCLVQPECCISHNVEMGTSCLLHANTLIGHDVKINDFVTIGSNVNILKDVEIGSYTVISPNSLIYPDVKIGKHVFVEPGAVVKESVEDYQTVKLKND